MKNKKILVTGGNGMVGRHLKKILPTAIFPSRDECDLTNIDSLRRLISSHTPDVIIHLAAKVGGIQDNIKKPAEYFDDNILMNTNILKVSKEYEVSRFVGILSTCIYPNKSKSYPMTEKDMFLGPPAPTNFSYGYSKRCMAVQIDAYNKQYNTKYNYITPCNLYSEYDNFTDNNKMHFITSLLDKIKKSKGDINLLGTGRTLRQFMYAGDLAQVIKEIIDKDITGSFNVAPTENLSIDHMAKISLDILNVDAKIKYTNPELDGQYRKDVSNKKMLTYLPNFKFTSFKKGIKKVYDKIS